MSIKKTTDYEMFNTVKGNRTLIKSHIGNLKSSILKRNLLHINPIIVNEKMQVVDGQHRLAAARSLSLPIFYVVEEGIGQKEIIELNANIKSWEAKNFIEMYVSQGNTEYMKLQAFMEKYNFPTYMSVRMLTGRTGWDDAWLAFKTGNLDVVNEEEAIDFAEKIMELKPYILGLGWKKSNFHTALKKVYEEISHEELMKMLQSQGTMFRLCNTLRDYLREFERIVNYRKRGSTGTIHFY